MQARETLGRLHWVTEQHGCSLKFVFSGELDMVEAPSLDREFAFAVPDGERTVVLDLADVTFIDSTGLRVLLKIQRSLNERGAQLVIGRMSEPVFRVFEVAGMRRVFAFLGAIPETAQSCPVCERAVRPGAPACVHCGSALST